MNKKILVPIIAAVIGVIALSSFYSSDEKESDAISKMNLSYDSSNSQIQLMLETSGIAMSNPLKLKGESIDQYCQFFSDENIQKFVHYCTSTELIDSNGQFIGNIHMVGDSDSPFVVLGIMQTDPFISEIDSVKTISEAMVKSLVCDCWENEKPGGFESVSEWVDAAKSHHLESKKITSKSEINNLAQKQLLIEISTNTEGYLWKFMVIN